MPSDARRAPTVETAECTLPDGRTLAYTCSGDRNGEPVIAHHGTPGSRLFGAVLAEAATAVGVRLVVPDRPGYGRSSPQPADWTWDDWRDDLATLREAESIDRAAQLGFSGGGPFAFAAATSDWTSRVGLVSSVVPPAENGLSTLSRIPFALRLFFRLSSELASVTGPGSVVSQYTDRSVPESVARAVADDFHEAFRQGAAAAARECRLFAIRALETDGLDVPVRFWHGTRDTNTPLDPVRTVATDVDGRLVTAETDHLGTLLDRRGDVFDWLDGNGSQQPNE